MKHKLCLSLALLLLPALAQAGQECTNDGHRWTSRAELDPTLAFYCHDDRFAQDMIVLGGLRLGAFVATEVALHRKDEQGRPLFREANGAMGHPAVRVGASVLLVWGTAAWARLEERGGHYGRAKWIRRGSRFVGAADFVWDMRQITKAQGR